MDQGSLDSIISVLGYVAGILSFVAAVTGGIQQLLGKNLKLFDRETIKYLWSSWSRRTPLLGIVVAIVIIILSVLLQQPIVLIVSLALLIVCVIFVLAVLLGPARRLLNPTAQNPKRAERFAQRKVIVGGKDFLEQDFLCEIVARVIKKGNPDLTVERRQRWGGTLDNYGALQDGNIDLYVEYTGTAMAFLRRLPLEEAREKQLWEFKDLFSDQNLVMLEPLGYNSGYVLVMLREKAEKLGIASISDLISHAGELIFKGTKEFDKRPDGFKALQKVYSLRFADKDIVLEEHRYDALRNREMDVTSGFNADPEINLEEDEFMKLIDDRNCFPAGWAAPLVHQDLLDCFPDIKTSLGNLAGVINEMEIASLTQKGIDKKYDKNPDSTGIRVLVDRFLEEKGL